MASKDQAGALLSEALGAPVVALPGLKMAEAEQLVAALASATQRQRETLKSATDAALSHVPMLLRGAVRKVLFG